MLCIIWTLIISQMAYAQIDLHAHLDMKPGVGPLLFGNSKQIIQAESWDTRLRSKASLESLDPLHSPKIIVVSLYGHPYLSNFGHFDLLKNVQDALEKEYNDIKEFVDKHTENFGIAKTPTEARALLTQKKIVFILSIEGAYGALETEADYKKWIDERGVAIITPFHLTEDHFGGTALLRPWAAIFNSPLSFLESLLITNFSCLSTFCQSPMGVKPDGDLLIRNLLARKVWIDLAHANEMEVREILPELEAKHLPLLITHTQIREVFPAERGVGNLETDYLTKNGGMIGLMPTEDYIAHGMKAPPSGCNEGIAFFRDIFQYTQKRLGEGHVALGSDSNAPIQGLSPRCKTAISKDSQSELEQKGYMNYLQWNELGDYISQDVNWNTKIIEAFLSTWERVRP